jgi:hypothetical protein
VRHFLFRWFFTIHQEQAQVDPKALLTEAVYFSNNDGYGREKILYSKRTVGYRLENPVHAESVIRYLPFM